MAAKQRLAVDRARLLLGCYRRIDAQDPDTYVTAIAETLTHYDDWIIAQATHPWTGIQRTEKFKAWPPNSGELADFCDDLKKRAARYAYYDTLPKPDVVWHPPATNAPRLPPPIDRSTRPTLEELAARHPDAAWAQNILKGAAASKPLTPQQRLFQHNEAMARNGWPALTQKEFDAIPDAKLPANWK
jgi:hypothetical protein